MKRDMDLIRTMLLEIEDGKSHFETTSDDVAIALGTEGTGLSRSDAERLEYHLTLLEESGLAKFTTTGEGWLVDGLSWRGHDFLDSVRDEEIWARTKEGAKAAKGFSFELITALAKGYLKKKIEDHTGLSIDL